MSIKVNDRVKVVKADGELSPLVGATGEVIRIYDLSRTIAAVKITPDETIAREIIIKLPVENLEKIGSQTQETEIPEGAKQISEADFKTALKEITNPETVFSDVSDPIHAMLEGMAATLFGLKLANILFEDTDVVIVTENDFVRALWKACDPTAVADNAAIETSAFDGLLMAVSSVIRLRELVPILFGGSND